MAPELMEVRRVRDGVVVDHLPVGTALEVLRLLKLGEGARVVVLMNVESSKLGRKDVVKVEGRRLSSDELVAISLLAPGATVNTVEDYRVVSKVKATPPEEVRGILRCPNPTCITNQEREPVTTVFRRKSEEPLSYYCTYCGTTLSGSELARSIRV